jgi:hypothetical protein
MGRTTSRAKSVQGPEDLILPQGLQATEFRAQRPEDETERAFRLKKEYWSFLVKDLLAYCLALVLILAAALYAFSILLSSQTAAEDRQFAMSILTSLLTAVAGFAFGKASR